MTRRSAARAWRVLAKRVRLALHTAWDPISIAGEPGAQTEYQDYVPEIVRLLVRDASAADIAALLTAIARERMGLPGGEARDRRVAEMLIDLYKVTDTCAGF